MLKYFLSIVMMLLICTGPAQADFYKWEDENGVLHITDYPPPSQSAGEPKIYETDSNADRSPVTPPRQAAPLPPPASTVDRPKTQTACDVILYTTAWCPHSQKARAFFDARGIRYTEYDVEKDREAAQRKKRMGSHGVPFAIINGEPIHGFSPSRYEAALRKSEFCPR